MTPVATLSAPPTGAAVCCTVAAYAALRLTADEITPLRKPVHPLTGAPVAPAFLKNADEQTVAAVAAVFQAIRDHGLQGERFTDWGAVAAPRFLGRATMGVVLHRFQQEGAWGISPHHIPHRSLHAVSGTISQALKMHGPNFGVGGGPGADSEVLLIAAAMLAQQSIPGLWVVMSGHAPELVPADPAAPAPPASPEPAPVCSVVALALTPGAATRSGLQLRVSPGAPRGGGAENGCGPAFAVEMLQRVLAGEGRAPLGGWSLNCGGRVELQRVGGENCL